MPRIVTSDGNCQWHVTGIVTILGHVGTDFAIWGRMGLIFHNVGFLMLARLVLI